MYIIDIKIKADKDYENRADELLQIHRQWISKGAEAGNFLMAGPSKDIPMSGFVVAQVENRQELDKIISKDAYYPDLASYDIREFQANIIAENITEYRGK